MLRISKLADYATLIMHQLALESARIYSATEIAKQAHITVTTASKTLKMLLEAGLVSSVRGAGGGYRLSRSADTITLAEVVAAIDGQLALTECNIPSKICAQDSVCALRSNWRLINKVIMTALQSVTVAEMTRPLSEHKLMQQNMDLALSKKMYLESVE